MEWNNQEMEERVRWLLAKGARVRGTGALRSVVGDIEGSVRVAEVLLENGADVEGFDEGGEHTMDSTLMEAVRVGNGEMVRLLIKWKADVGWQNETGETPLELAEKGGKSEICALLKEAKKEHDEVIHD